MTKLFAGLAVAATLAVFAAVGAAAPANAAPVFPTMDKAVTAAVVKADWEGDGRRYYKRRHLPEGGRVTRRYHDRDRYLERDRYHGDRYHRDRYYGDRDYGDRRYHGRRYHHRHHDPDNGYDGPDWQGGEATIYFEF